MTVLSPWRALERNDLTVTHWHGDVTLGSPFPSRFYHGGADLLSGPVRFLVTVASHSGAQEISATPTLSSEAEDEITWTYAWSGSGVSATGTITVHETGMVTCGITLDPFGSQQFTSIKLEIPLNPEICQYLRDGNTSGNSSLYTPIPTWTDGEYSVPPGSTSDEWKRFVSVANDRLGLQWCFESDANHKSPSILINQTTGLATIEIVTATRTQSANFGYQFTLSPLPCRPLVPDWVLSTRFGITDSSPEYNRFLILAGEASEEIAFKGTLTPFCDLEEFEGQVLTWHERNLKVGGMMSTQYWLDDEDSGYDDDWRNTDRASYFGGTGTDIYKRCGDPHATPKPYRKIKFWLEDFQENFLAQLDEQFAPGVNHFDALYLDVHNTQPAFAFTDDFSRSNVVQMPFALHREWCKAVYERCEGSGRPLIGHPQHLFNARCHAYSHFVVVGEEISTPQTGGEFLTLQEFSPAQDDIAAGPTPDDAIRRRFYMNTLPMRYWRSVANSRVTGVAVVLLPELWRTGVDLVVDQAIAFPTENCLAMCRLHGVGFWKSFSYRSTVDQLYASEAVFGLTGNSRFYGYWQSNCPATTADPDAKISVYREGNKLLVYVVNFADEDREIEFQVPSGTEDPVLIFYGKGLGDGYRGSPTETPFTASVDGDAGSYTVCVARENFASVQITLSETAAPVAAYHFRRQRCCR